MLDNGTKKRIDSARDILVGKVPDPKSQVEQITIAMIYKFMDDMDNQTEELGGKATFFAGEFKQYAWSRLLDRRFSGHERLIFYAEGIEKMNINENIPQLFRDIFKGAFLPYRDPETLNLFLKEINGFTYDHSERLGDAFEYLLSVLSSQGDAGQFRTPRHVIDFIVEIVNPVKEDSVLDPACGTAGFLISSYKHILLQNTKDRPGDLLTTDDKGRLMTNFCGYDISPDMVRLSLVNMYLHGFANPAIDEYDALTSEDRWDERYDVIMANPPFMSPKGGIRPHSRFTVKAKRSEVLFVDYIAEHLNVHGKAGVIVPEGIIFQSQNAYRNLRKMLLEDGYLYAVASLPAGVFQPYSGVKTSILLMDKTLAKKINEILFVKVANDGFDLGAQRRPIDKNDLPQALKIVKAWKQVIVEGNGFEIDEVDKAIAHTVSKKKIAESGDYNLSGDRYREVISYAKVKWPMVELGEVCEIFNGSTPSRMNDEYWNSGTIPWFTIEDVREQGRIIFSTKQKITKQALQETSVKLLPKYSVLLCCTASVGEYAFAKIETTTNQQFNGLVVKSEYKEKLLPDFLFSIASKFKSELIRLSGKTSFNFVSVKLLKSIRIPLPPLEVQKKIVAELDGYQKIIDGAKQIVENYKPTIKIDPAWEIMALGKLVKFVQGTQVPLEKQKTEYKDGFVRFIRIVDYTQNSDDIRYVENRGNKYICDEKEIIMVRYGASAGFVGRGIKGIFANNLFAIRIQTENLNNDFLFYFLKSDIFESFKKANVLQAAMPALSHPLIGGLPTPLPPLETQQKIVAEIESERELVKANKRLIEIFEKKINDKIGEVWGE